MTYYCWNCYGRNPDENGACVHCGREISAPLTADENGRLVWALHHPDPDVAIMAARRLATTADERSAEALREAISDPPDPYVAAEALQSLLSISSVTREERLLEHLAESGPIMLRNIASKALGVRTLARSEGP